MFRIEMLPALHGDCLWIEYGAEGHTNRILIDGGPLPAYYVLRKRLNDVPQSQRRFELFVLTHIDNDHIDGAVKLLNVEKLDFEVGEIWFNAWKHLSPSNRLTYGPVQAEYVSALIGRHGLRWNQAFRRGPIAVSPDGGLPSVRLPGGMEITLLSPDDDKLRRLVPVWANIVRAAGLEPGGKAAALDLLSAKKRYRPPVKYGVDRSDLAALAQSPFKSDDSLTNDSSIAFLAEFEGKRAVFLGDAHAPAVVSAVRRLLNRRGVKRLAVDAVKLAHHCSRDNVSRELIEAFDSRLYLISTNGGKNFGHPHEEAVARVIEYAASAPVLCFNYLSDTTGIWKTAAEQGSGGFKVRFPEVSDAGLAVDL